MTEIPDSLRFRRQLDYIDHRQLAKIHIHVIGAGAIGSATTLLLAKMGCRKITIWDFDLFEEHNLPNQLCRIADIGKPKAEAVAELVKEFEGIEIEACNERFDGDVNPGDYIISCVDSMDARKEIWEKVSFLPISCLIDGRMGLTTMNLYSYLPNIEGSKKRYQETLWEDDEVAPVRCTAKSTIFTANTIASLICHTVTMVLKKEVPPASEITMSMTTLPMIYTLDANGRMSEAFSD